MPTTGLEVREMDHIVLRCTDVEANLDWYIGRLGLAPVRVDEWRRGEALFPSVRVSPDTIIDFFEGVAEPGRLDHLCLVVAPTDLGALAASGRFEVLDGPGPRFGARGEGISLYVRDPEGTTVELRYYEADRGGRGEKAG